jgi:hypothetical protein
MNFFLRPKNFNQYFMSMRRLFLNFLDVCLTRKINKKILLASTLTKSKNGSGSRIIIYVAGSLSVIG